jgi:hypothetical protein
VLVEPRNNRTVCGAFRGLGAVGVIALIVAVACGTDSKPGDAPRTTVPAGAANSVDLIASASVLITADPDEPTAEVDSIAVTPGAVVADPGETVQLSAVAYGQGGEELPDVEVVWSIADPRAGTIAADGKFRAGTTPGEYADSVSATGIQNTPAGIRYSTGFASVTVVGVARVLRLASVAAIPGSAVLVRHQIYRMRAIGLDENGLVIPGVRFVWKLNDARLGRINDIGYLTVDGDEGRYPDVVSVTGIWEGVTKTASSDVTVVTTPERDGFLAVHALPQRFFLNPGDRMQLTAVALNGLGELAAGTVLRWSMADAAAGSIDGAGNFVAAAVPGVYTESVRVEAVLPGESGFVTAVDYASVVIREIREPERLKSVSVMPDVIVVPSGGRVTLRIMALDEAGAAVENMTLHWEAVDPKAGEVSPLGSFRAGDAAGRYTDALSVRVEQTIGGETVEQVRTVDVVVTGTLSTAEISPSLAVVASGRTIHFSVVGWDENDVRLAGLVVIWSISDDSIGKMDNFGNFTAGRVAGLYEGAVRARIVQRLPDPR